MSTSNSKGPINKKKRQPYRVDLPEKGITITSFQANALFCVDKTAVLGLTWEGDVPEGTIAIRYDDRKGEKWERWYPTSEAISILRDILQNLGVKFVLRDDKLQLLVDGDEVKNWPTNEAVKKADWDWLLPVANATDRVTPEILTTMFPKA